jgi:hypothetical protein
VDNKGIGALLAALSAYFFYQPFVRFNDVFYQSGEHLGGIAYALILLPIAFAVANWFRQKQLALLFSICATLLSVQYLIRIGPANAAFGIWCIFICSVIMVILSFQISSEGQTFESSE